MKSSPSINYMISLLCSVFNGEEDVKFIVGLDYWIIVKKLSDGCLMWNFLGFYNEQQSNEGFAHYVDNQFVIRCLIPMSCRSSFPLKTVQRELKSVNDQAQTIRHSTFIIFKVGRCKASWKVRTALLIIYFN